MYGKRVVHYKKIDLLPPIHDKVSQGGGVFDKPRFCKKNMPSKLKKVIVIRKTITLLKNNYQLKIKPSEYCE